MYSSQGLRLTSKSRPVARRNRISSSTATQRPAGHSRRASTTTWRRLATAVSPARRWPLIASTRWNSSKAVVPEPLAARAARSTACGGWPRAFRPAAVSPSVFRADGGQPRRLHQRRPGVGPDGQVRGRVAVVLATRRPGRRSRRRRGRPGRRRSSRRSAAASCRSPAPCPPRSAAGPPGPPARRRGPSRAGGAGPRRRLSRRRPQAGGFSGTDSGRSSLAARPTARGAGDERAEDRVQVGRELPVPRQEQPQRRRALRPCRSPGGGRTWPGTARGPPGPPGRASPPARPPGRSSSSAS